MNGLDHDTRTFDTRDGTVTSPRRQRPRREPVRVLVAGDSRLIAEALMFTLDSDPALEPVGYALDGWEALELVAVLAPDVILVGSQLPALDSLAFTRLVHMVWPQVLIIMLAQTQVPHEVEEAIGVGAADYLPLDRSTAELLDAITRACLRQTRFEGQDATPEPNRQQLAPDGALIGASLEYSHG
jgi:DNA-binding NarL/FixJ family response regulator